MKPAICLEGFLSPKAKFKNKIPWESYGKKRPFQKAEANPLMSYFIYSWYRFSMWMESDIQLAHFKKGRRCLQRLSPQRTSAEHAENSPLRYDFDMDLLNFLYS